MAKLLMRVHCLSLLAAVLLLPSCGGESDAGPPPSAGVPARGGGLTVSAALRSTIDDVLLVRGALFVEDGKARLCEAQAESYPPQCAGASIDVERIPPEEREKLMKSEDGRVEWSEGEVRLLGRVEDGVLVVDATARAR